MVKIGRFAEFLDDDCWQPFSRKEYDSNGDTIPDLQSILDSDEEGELSDDADSNCEMAKMLADLNVSEDTDVSSIKEMLLAPPLNFNSMYTATVEDGEEKLILIEIEEGSQCHLRHAVAQKAEDLLETLQPYPRDPANVLQFRGHRFLACLVDKEEVLIHD